MKRHSHLIVFILQMIVVLAYIVFAVTSLITIPEAITIFEEEGALLNGEELAWIETIFRALMVYIPIFALVWTAAWGIAGYVRRWNRNRTTVFTALACVGILPLLFDFSLLSLFALVCGVIYLAVIVFFIIYSRY